MFGGGAYGGGNGGGSGGGDSGSMFSALVRSFCTKAAKIPAAHSPYNLLGKFALSAGAATMSAGYSALFTKEGQRFTSDYLNRCFSGESSKLDANDFDGS